MALRRNMGVTLANGKLFGTTAAGGFTGCAITTSAAAGCGVIFELTPGPSVWSEIILAQVQPRRGAGADPVGVALGPSGLLYGTTSTAAVRSLQVPGWLRGRIRFNHCGKLHRYRPIAGAAQPTGQSHSVAHPPAHRFRRRKLAPAGSERRPCCRRHRSALGGTSLAVRVTAAEAVAERS